MGFGNRAFLVDKDDTVRKFSYTKLDGLLMGDSQELLPELANSRIRYAIIRLETRERRPVRVIGAEFGFLKIDHLGRVDEDERRRQIARVHAAIRYIYGAGGAQGKARVRVGETPTSLIHAVHRFVRQGYDGRYRWKPSDKVLAAIGAVIFGAA